MPVVKSPTRTRVTQAPGVALESPDAARASGQALMSLGSGISRAASGIAQYQNRAAAQQSATKSKAAEMAAKNAMLDAQQQNRERFNPDGSNIEEMNLGSFDSAKSNYMDTFVGDSSEKAAVNGQWDAARLAFRQSSVQQANDFQFADLDRKAQGVADSSIQLIRKDPKQLDLELKLTDVFIDGLTATYTTEQRESFKKQYRQNAMVAAVKSLTKTRQYGKAEAIVNSELGLQVSGKDQQALLENIEATKYRDSERDLQDKVNKQREAKMDLDNLQEDNFRTFFRESVNPENASKRAALRKKVDQAMSGNLIGKVQRDYLIKTLDPDSAIDDQLLEAQYTFNINQPNADLNSIEKDVMVKTVAGAFKGTTATRVMKFIESTRNRGESDPVLKRREASAEKVFNTIFKVKKDLFGNFNDTPEKAALYVEALRVREQFREQNPNQGPMAAVQFTQNALLSKLDSSLESFPRFIEDPSNLGSVEGMTKEIVRINILMSVGTVSEEEGLQSLKILDKRIENMRVRDGLTEAVDQETSKGTK